MQKMLHALVKLLFHCTLDKTRRSSHRPILLLFLLLPRLALVQFPNVDALPRAPQPLDVAAELDFIVSILVDLTLKLRPSINK